jgi:hypothetical protein
MFFLEQKNLFQLNFFEKTHNFLFSASTLAEKLEWIKMIRDNLRELANSDNKNGLKFSGLLESQDDDLERDPLKEVTPPRRISLITHVSSDDPGYF